MVFEVYRKFPICFKEVSRVLTESFKGVSRKYKGVSRKYKGVSRKFQECFKKVSGKFQGY